MNREWSRGFCVAIIAAFATCRSEQPTLTWPEVQQMIDRDYPGVPWITTNQLAEWLASPETQPIILDVRAPEEYDVSHLNNARLAPSLDEAKEQLDDLKKGQPIVVYCSVGYRSARVAKRLGEAGYANVYNLNGSIFQWANEGRPVYRQGNEVGKVHPYDEYWGQLLKSKLRARPGESKSNKK